MVDSKLTPYSNADAENDLSTIIAQMTAGFVGAIPEEDDIQLAKKLVQNIEESLCS